MFALLLTVVAAQGMGPSADLQSRYLDANGVKATYTRSVDADGTVHLKGRYEDRSRTRFHYKLRGNKVDAEIGGVPYVFEAPRDR